MEIQLVHHIIFEITYYTHFFISWDHTFNMVTEIQKVCSTNTVFVENHVYIPYIPGVASEKRLASHQNVLINMEMPKCKKKIDYIIK